MSNFLLSETNRAVFLGTADQWEGSMCRDSFYRVDDMIIRRYSQTQEEIYCRADSWDFFKKKLVNFEPAAQA